MRLNDIQPIVSFAEAEGQIANRETRNKPGSIKLANNTYLEKVALASAFAVRLHNTYILTVDEHDNVTLNSGGWQTKTTKDRLGRLTPSWITIHQRCSGVPRHGSHWFVVVTGHDDVPRRYPYTEGFQFNLQTRKVVWYDRSYGDPVNATN